MTDVSGEGRPEFGFPRHENWVAPRMAPPSATESLGLHVGEQDTEQLAVQLAQLHFENTEPALVDTGKVGLIAHFPFEVPDKVEDEDGSVHENREIIATTTGNYLQILAHEEYLRLLTGIKGVGPLRDILSLIDQTLPDKATVIQTVFSLSDTRRLEASLERHDDGKLHGINYRICSADE